MINSLSSPAAARVRMGSTQKSANSAQAPFFSGKHKKNEAQDVVSLKKHQSGTSADASLAGVNPASLKKLMLLSLLLGGNAANAASVDTGKTSGGHNFFKRDGLPDLQINQSVASLVPGLTVPQAVEILQRPPFAPIDNNVFNNVVYGGIIGQPASNRTISDDEVKSTLKDTLTARFGKKDPQVDAGMALFDSKELKAVVPDARLRGAMVNLLGTTGEAAIDAYKNGVFGQVDFADLPQGYIGRSITLSNETAPRVQINGRYASEDFRLHSQVLGHEALHQDLHLSVAEERIAHALDSLVHAQVVLENPNLIKDNTEYTQRLNTKLMARLNTRDKDGKIRLYESQGNVYPGGKVPLKSFGDNFMDTGIDTSNGVTDTVTSPGNPVLHGELKKSSGKQNDTADFDGGTEAVIDQNQNVLDPVGLVALAKALKLDIGDIPKPSTTATGEASTSTPTGKPTNDPAHDPQSSGARRRHRILWFDV